MDVMRMIGRWAVNAIILGWLVVITGLGVILGVLGVDLLINFML